MEIKIIGITRVKGVSVPVQGDDRGLPSNGSLHSQNKIMPFRSQGTSARSMKITTLRASRTSMSYLYPGMESLEKIEERHLYGSTLGWAMFTFDKTVPPLKISPYQAHRIRAISASGVLGFMRTYLPWINNL